VSKLSDHEVSVQELVETDFNIYPNPTNGMLMVATEDQNESLKVELLNANMQLVQTFETNAQVQLDDLSAGIYFVKSGTSVQRLVKY
jgi:hypothetical protein